MALRSRRTTRWVIVALALLLVAAAWDAVRLQERSRLNEAILTGKAPRDDRMPELRFAAAAEHAASGAAETALNQYRALQGDSPLGQAARFNSANLLLRQAKALRDNNQSGQAVPMIELAKETYREVLRNDPEHWPARYNLERAQRLLPDAEDDGDSVAEPPNQAERAATTMRGYSPGLP